MPTGARSAGGGSKGYRKGGGYGGSKGFGVSGSCGGYGEYDFVSKHCAWVRVKHKSSMGALSHIIKNEGAKSLFKSDGANIVRAIAGAVVLSRYDKLQLITLGCRMDGLEHHASSTNS
ncbi:ADP,ATP carrier protein 1, mitochondrial-like protein, partial [Tanacetum coccineum]